MRILHVYCGLVATSVAVVLFFYVTVWSKNNFVANTSIELNFIGSKQILSASNKSDAVRYNFQNSSNLKRKRKYHVPKFMLELYETNKIAGLNNSKPDVVRSLIPKHAGPYFSNDILEDSSDNHLLIFDLPTSNEDEEFLSAELKILTVVEINTDALKGVTRILKLSVYDDISETLLFTQESQVYHINNTWLSFNLTKPVTEILSKTTTTKYLKILITIASSLEFKETENQLKLSLLPLTDTFEHDYPVLLLSYVSNNNGDVNKKVDIGLRERLEVKRKKRNIEDEYEEETNKLWDNEAERMLQQKKLKKMRNTCRKRPLYIDFAEIRYDEWIVQPSGYEAYQCQGRCFYPVAEHLDPTKHAIVQALLHSVAPSKVSRSCCVPTELTSISILYVDDKGVLTYRYAYKDMVVVDCGCR